MLDATESFSRDGMREKNSPFTGIDLTLVISGIAKNPIRKEIERKG